MSVGRIPMIKVSAGNLTYKEARYVSARINGVERTEAARRAGFPPHMVLIPSRIEKPNVIEAIETCRAELAEFAVLNGLADAAELHEFLTDAIRADANDFESVDGRLLDVEFSEDDEGKRRVTKRLPSKMKAAELLAKLKVVDALKDTGNKNELHLHVNEKVTEVLQAALQREQKMIEGGEDK